MGPNKVALAVSVFSAVVSTVALAAVLIRAIQTPPPCAFEAPPVRVELSDA